jgi:hypothetical protein
VHPFSNATSRRGNQISIPPSDAVRLTKLIADTPPVQLIGLGARDSLRLEAGMCLYGHDLDETVSPIEAGLAWLVGEYLGSSCSQFFRSPLGVLNADCNRSKPTLR